MQVQTVCSGNLNMVHIIPPVLLKLKKVCKNVLNLKIYLVSVLTIFNEEANLTYQLQTTLEDRPLPNGLEGGQIIVSV